MKPVSILENLAASIPARNPVEGKPMKESPGKIVAQNVNFYYGKTHALKGVSLELKENRITALIGPLFFEPSIG
jgi:ABC-type multidrug transport system fused ATPase/permease subunit